MASKPNSIFIAARPEQVFDLYLNMDRMHEWVNGVTKVTDVTGPPDRAGTRYTVWFGRSPGHYEVLEAERPRHVKTRFKAWYLSGVMDVTLEPEGNGTRVTGDLKTDGLIAAITAFIFSHMPGPGSFQAEMAKFVELVEREAASG